MKKVVLATAVLVMLMAAQGRAATVEMLLTDVRLINPSGVERFGDLAGSTATFEFETSSGVLTQTGGSFDVLFILPPPSTLTLYRHVATDLVLGSGAAASASSYGCIDGTFFIQLGQSACIFIPLSSYDAFETKSWDGTTLVMGNYPFMGNEACAQGDTFCEPQIMYQWTLEAQVVPLPAAAWLFGGALALLGWLRRAGAPA
ncbi:MAG: VPLPA-CTERM sorting domain-containing protein [Chromatiales bacterium]|nr:VPLPA-CTERM sorting domain-containing protein [Chromatiales bacterium]